MTHAEDSKPAVQLDDRYSRQMLFAPIGKAGQQRIAAGRVVLVGCGALGTASANLLARAGVGHLRLIDRDYVELHNLQRQTLFDETDAHEGRPKATAAAALLSKINSSIEIEPHVADVHSGNIEKLIADADVIVDGTDNFETRYLINDVAVKTGTPWVYGACVGDQGMALGIVPGRTPCLRCIFDAPPPAGSSPTCDTAGVLASAAQMVAAVQVAEALKVLLGKRDELTGRMMQCHIWTGEYSTFDMAAARVGEGCDCCGAREFRYLDGADTGRTAALCGRDAVQVRPASDTQLDLEALAQRIAPIAKAAPTVNRYLLRFAVDAFGVTVFRDGRAIIKGATTPEEGRTIYAKYIGS